MSDMSQENRPLRIAIDGVPADDAIITAFSGEERVSRLYRFTCEITFSLAAPLTFGQILGKSVVVSIQQAGGEWRFVHGLFSKLTEGKRTDRFASFTGELVPKLWLLTRNRRSRLFQTMTTEDILKEVLGTLYPMGSAFNLEGTYHPRNICAQYHESDFEFASRLMEEEGMYYYFTHSQGEHGIVISDNPRGAVPLPGTSTLDYQDGANQATAGGRVFGWQKAQELRTLSFTLTDHSFEMPDNQFQAMELPGNPITAGTVTHDLAFPNSDQLENVQHPGGYVRWRDGVAPGGGDRADDLSHVFDDNARLVKVRAEEELSTAVTIKAGSTYTQLTPGHTFTLSGHVDADGDYLLTSVSHEGKLGATAAGGTPAGYSNAFTCVPAAAPFRPERTTRKPVIRGTQTGVVVGSDGAEIDPDKYGRVKVWFRWDPAGPRGLDTSCWVRVAQFWAGKAWGAQFLPRVGDEVVVAFENGDPDQPVILGSLYNADNLPIYKLPDHKTQSGIKTHSSTGGDSQNFNEIKFEDKKGQELVSIHAEKDMSVTVENNYSVSVGANQKDPRKTGTNSTTTFGDTKFTVSKGDYDFKVAAGKAEYTVEGLVKETFNSTQTTVVAKEIDISSTSSSIHLTSPTEILLTVKDSFIKITPDTITLSASKIHFEGGAEILGKATLVKFEGGDKFEALAPHVAVDGKTDAVFQSSGGKADVTAASKATLGVSGQTVVCDPSAVAIAGASVKSSATGVQEITGALVKIN